MSLLVWAILVSGLQVPLSIASTTSTLDVPDNSNSEPNRNGDQIHEPAAMVVETESIGTAWPIAYGYLVTNNHVVADAESITLIDQTGREFIAWPVLLDELYDIAFLEVSDGQALPPALPLAGSRTALDTRVFTVGFPTEEMSKPGPQRTQGRICGLNGTGEDDASYRTTVSVRHGNSGGPLMNLTGEVVGVIRSMLAYRDVASEQTHVLENASCAVKIAAVKELLEFLPKNSPTHRTLTQPTGGAEALYTAVTHSVLRVVARHYERVSTD